MAGGQGNVTWCRSGTLLDFQLVFPGTGDPTFPCLYSLPEVYLFLSLGPGHE